MLARALLTHHARDPRSGTRVPDGEENFLGFGLPAAVPYCLECTPHTATLVFEDTLRPGYFLEWDDFPYPPSLKRNDKYFGEVWMTLAFVPTPMWDDAAADTREAFAELVEFLGERVRRFDLPEKSREALEWHRLIMEADLAGSLEREYETGRDQLSGSLRAQIERGRQVLAVDYRRALARVPILNNGFEPLFDEFDAILTPATAGTAPAGLASTGSPMFCTLWTLCGMPCISLPLLTGENGLPLGLQLVGRRGDDGRLLRTARWLSAALAQASP